MFQPYATTYGTLLTITSLFSYMRLQNHKNINTECPSLLRTEGVSLLPSAPPARLTAHPQTLAQRPLSLQTTSQLSCYHSSSAEKIFLSDQGASWGTSSLPETQQLLLAFFLHGDSGGCSITVSLIMAILLANEIRNKHLLSELNSQVFDHGVWCLSWKINSNKLSAARALLIRSPPCPRRPCGGSSWLQISANFLPRHPLAAVPVLKATSLASLTKCQTFLLSG